MNSKKPKIMKTHNIQVPAELQEFGSWVRNVCAIGTKGFLAGSGAQSIFLALDKNLENVVRISSEMHDYEERGEAGQICLQLLENSSFLQSDFDHFWKVGSPTRVQKLSFTTKDFSSDSGLTFTFENGHEVVIVAAAYPFYLSILGLSHGIETTPEFDISSYVKEDIFSISGQ
ncbi:hypothetical protein [Roseinatronobacter alkalisoli]|uniref:Uncharacterized protein n=1 Tax=Roseinatronobacter alkalisoli TaxID=3028235 RepID=A0ABT5TFV0_9RHOB|nr:hypothetical protein [Roseinatronobacter sp. HJB301]MDD7973896.1 hypothetical protein [Roseinatronobacter sp. HJB301]